MATSTLSTEQRARLSEIRDAAITIRETLDEMHADIGLLVDAAVTAEETANELLNERRRWPPAKSGGSSP
jgi:hypothetical protein